MRITNIVKYVARKIGAMAIAGGMMLPGVAILLGGMSFVGEAQAISNVILFEDFENDGNDSWGGGSDSFGRYHGTLNTNWSNSPHSSVPGGGDWYGHLIDTVVFSPGTHASIDGGPLVSAPIDLTPGHNTIEFDGWLASWASEADYARFEAEFFDGLGGGGSSLGSVVLVDGSVSTGAVDSVGITGALGAAWNQGNWSHYVTSNPIPAGAMSVEITYVGDTLTSSNMNDAYAENILISTAIPEPTSAVLIGVGAMGLVGVLRRKRPYGVSRGS